jgi:hypothetical protein
MVEEVGCAARSSLASCRFDIEALRPEAVEHAMMVLALRHDLFQGGAEDGPRHCEIVCPRVP